MSEIEDLAERVSQLEQNVMDMLTVVQKIQADYRQAVAAMEQTAKMAEEFRDATRALLKERKSGSTH